jgi:hypothetical protein
VLARALPVLREIVVAHDGHNVLVVSHKATLRLLISSLLGFDARGYRDRLDQSPACLNVVDFKDPVRARLMLFNDVSHYQDQPRRPQGNLSKWWDAGPETRSCAPAPRRNRLAHATQNSLVPAPDIPTVAQPIDDRPLPRPPPPLPTGAILHSWTAYPN